MILLEAEFQNLSTELFYEPEMESESTSVKCIKDFCFKRACFLLLALEQVVFLLILITVTLLKSMDDLQIKAMDT